MASVALAFARLAWFCHARAGVVLAATAALVVAAFVAAPQPTLKLSGHDIVAGGADAYMSTMAVIVDSKAGDGESARLLARLQDALLSGSGVERRDLLLPDLEFENLQVLPGVPGGSTADLRLVSPVEERLLLVVFCRSEAAERTAVEVLRHFAQRHPAERIRHVSARAAQDALGLTALVDLTVAVPLAVLALLLAGWAALGSLLVAGMCVAEAGLSIAVGCLAASAFGVPVYVTTLVAPVLTLSLGVADDLYFLAALFQSPHGSMPRRIYRAAQRTCRPIFTSAACLLATLALIAATEAAAYRSFALYGACSVALSFAMTFTALPALLAWVGVRQREAAGQRARYAVCAWLGAEGRLLRIGKPWSIGALALFLVCAAGMWKLEVADNWLGALGARNPVAQLSDELAQSFGADSLVSVDLTYRDDAVIGVRQLQDLDALAAVVAKTLPGVSVLSIADVGTRLSESLAVVRPPPDELRARMVRAVVGSRMPALYDPGSRDARYRILMGARQLSSVDVLRLRRAIEQWSTGNSHFTVSLSSELFGHAAAIERIVRLQLRNLGLSIATMCLIALAFGVGWRGTAILFASSSAVVACLYGLCGWLGISLGISTALFGSIIVALGVGFNMYVVRGSQHAGSAFVMPATLTASLVVGVGLLPLALGSAPPLVRLAGMVAAGCILSAMAAITISVARARPC